MWRKAFLKSLSDQGVVRVACEDAGVDPTTAYNNRRSDPQFAAQWQESLDLAADALESEIRRRAFAGVRLACDLFDERFEARKVSREGLHLDCAARQTYRARAGNIERRGREAIKRGGELNGPFFICALS